MNKISCLRRAFLTTRITLWDAISPMWRILMLPGGHLITANEGSWVSSRRRCWLSAAWTQVLLRNRVFFFSSVYTVCSLQAVVCCRNFHQYFVTCFKFFLLHLHLGYFWLEILSAVTFRLSTLLPNTVYATCYLLFTNYRVYFSTLSCLIYYIAAQKMNILL